MKNTKITNVKTTVALKKDFTYTYYGVDTTIPKGTEFNVKNFGHNGIVIVLGHGAAEVIPHDYLGKYTKTYTVTEEIFDGRNGYDTYRKTVKEDVTKEWLAHWKEVTAKKVAAEDRAERIRIKGRIAHLRKTIKFVKRGDADKELAELLEKVR